MIALGATMSCLPLLFLQTSLAACSLVFAAAAVAEDVAAGVESAALELRDLTRRPPRATVRRCALRGIADSGWRTMYESRDPNTFLSLMGVTPEMFDEILAQVRLFFFF